MGSIKGKYKNITALNVTTPGIGIHHNKYNFQTQFTAYFAIIIIGGVINWDIY